VNKQASISDIVKILDHDRASTNWIVRPYIAADGTAKIERIARIVCVYPRDGAGRLQVAVTDWGIAADGRADGRPLPSQFITSARGFGYDKLSAALAGCTVGGVEVGDHCDSAGRPTVGALVQSRGWEVFGQDVRSSG
jgi:hypothetical protein